MTRGPARFHSLLHSADLLEKRLATLLTPVGIPPRQARILNALTRMGEVSQSALAAGFGVTSGSMSTMIERMVAAGLIERRRSPEDRRRDLLSVTERGRAALGEIRDVWREIDDLIEERLGPEKAERLADLTRELKLALGGTVAASREGVAEARRRTAEEAQAAAARPADVRGETE